MAWCREARGVALRIHVPALRVDDVVAVGSSECHTLAAVPRVYDGLFGQLLSKVDVHLVPLYRAPPHGDGEVGRPVHKVPAAEAQN